MSVAQTEYLSRRVGFVILCVSIVFISVWLDTRGKAALQSRAQSIPALASFDNLTFDDLKRFRTDVGYLPDEPLLGFVEIPAGEFTMGSNPQVDRFAFENERWSQSSFQGQVRLPTFYIGHYEVTIAQFRAFVVADGHKAASDVLAGAPTNPVTNVSWTDALAYSRWLNEMLTQSPATPSSLRALLDKGWRVTLPTEAQWEKAARGTDGRIYPWGNAPNRERANVGSGDVVAVGRFRCRDCVYGLADMIGNVWELTSSPNRPYPFDEKIPADTQSDALFVMRGGSYSDADTLARAAVRGGIDPGARSPLVGFRIALTPPN